MKETIEIKAGELNLNVPYTREGLEVVRAMVTLLEDGLPPMGEEKIESAGEEEKIKGGGKTQEKSEENPEKTHKTSEKHTKAYKESITQGKSTPQSVSSPVLPSPKQRVKHKGFEAIAMTKAGTIYKEVVNRFLEEYKDGVVPASKKLFQIIQGMYGTDLKKTTIATYVSAYKRYIRENKLAEIPSKKLYNILKEEGLFAKQPQEKDADNPNVGRSDKTETKDPLPIRKVVEIWNLLPDVFEYKQVKALIGASIQQSAARIDATNYIIREFKENPAFECEETSPGVFLKKVVEGGEGEAGEGE